MAEMLGTMYDASLDQFKPHNWQFNPISHPIYYSRTYRRAHQSFGNTQFEINNLNRAYYGQIQQHFDALNWFGFSFNNNHWVKQQYLNSIRPVIAKNSYDATKPNGFIYGIPYDSTTVLKLLSPIKNNIRFCLNRNFNKF